MKRTIISICIVLVSQLLNAQQYFGTPAAKGHRCLVLMNPTENNLKTIFYLIDNHIFDLPADYNLVGFYYKSQAYNFQLSANFINSSGRKNVYLQSCDSLLGDMIFGSNPCSNLFKKVFEGSQGIIFFGGPDIPPAFYLQKTGLLTEISDYNRHAFEVSFLFHLLGGYQDENFPVLLDHKPGYRILGICLGMQTINVATGGTLIQDIPSGVYKQETAEQIISADPELRHRNYNTNLGLDNDLISGHFHRIKMILPERMTMFLQGSDTNPYVLSNHHQAAGRLGKSLKVAATSMDGRIVEAIVHEKYQNVIGIQFHPEPMFLYQSDNRFRRIPGQLATESFTELYGGLKGEIFNRNIWKWLGEVYK